MNELCYETINRSPFITPGARAELPAQIDAAAAAGFACVGLDAASVAQHHEGGGSAAELRRQLDALGLHCFELQPLVVTADERATLAQADEFAGLAEVLGARWIQCGISAPPDAAVLANFARAAERAAQGGARLAVEYLPFLPLCSIATTRAFLRRVNAPGAAIVVDAWHFFHGPDTWADLEALPLPELAYPQFDDHPAIVKGDWMNETTQKRMLPGDGCFELERFAGAFRAKGYAGPVSVEILSEELRALTPIDFARRVHAASRPYWT